MNLRKNGGFTGIDVSVAVIAIIIFFPTAFGVSYNLSVARAKSSRAVESIIQAVEILEEAKGQDIENVESYLKSKYTGSNGTGGFVQNVTKNDVSYKIEVSYKYPTEYNEADELTHLAKIITVKVTYPIEDTTKTIEMSTVLKKNLENI